MYLVQDIMTKEVKTVTPKTAVTVAAGIMLDHHLNGLPVVDEEGHLVGIICQSDLIVQQKSLPIPSVFNLLDGLIPLSSPGRLEREVQKISASVVSEAMTAGPVTVNPKATIEEAATLMVTRNIHTLPVVDEGRLVGVVGKEDILRTLMPGG